MINDTNHKPPLYASFDVETDGNNPMQHSMRSLGIALFDSRHAMVDTFYYNLEPQPSATVEASCYANFWAKRPELWQAVQRDTHSAEWVMTKLSAWLHRHSSTHRIQWVANPANFDWMFLKCYYEKYGPASKYNIGFFCHDLSALLRAYTLLNHVRDREAFIARLRNGYRITHHSLDDAICQGHMYMNLRALLRHGRFPKKTHLYY